MLTSSGFFQLLPKVELHRHLEGSLRLKTMQEVARSQGLSVPAGTRPLLDLVQVQESEPNTYQNFLSKFDTLRLFYRSPEIIHRVTREAIEDAARDNIRYLELRFTPVALSRAERFPLGEVMDWVCDATARAAAEFGITARLIASVNRHESVELAEQVAWLAADRIPCGILGLDLAGNEAEFPSKPFEGIFVEARQAGLKLTVHAGEWAGASSVRAALEDLHSDRIGHGVRVLEDAQTLVLAVEHQAAFEVCLTSNYQTGVVPSIKEHPLLRMLQAGLKVTLCTDDPSISQISLSDEYQRACQDLELEPGKLKGIILAAAQASFLPETERKILVEGLRGELEI
jgi:adenosine deaminase